MSRIQQILSKAERDGTARRFAAVEETTSTEAPPIPQVLPPRLEARGPSRAVADQPMDPREALPIFEPPATEIDEDPSGAENAGESSLAAPVSVEATLDPLLVAALQPLSAAGEQYRSLRSRISQAENGHAIRVIQLTSPGRHDGKTMTALNLALTMAQEFQQRVLVVDADLRQPRVHELLGLPPGPGLVDVLTGAATLEQALIEIPEYRLTVLRAGRAYERPAEMLGSAPMRRLVDTLRTHFDRIVVDSASAAVADPGAVAAVVDRLLLVVRAGSTTRPAIARAMGALGASKLLGLVFNESRAPQQGQDGAGA